jgi:hypothetical protein
MTTILAGARVGQRFGWCWSRRSSARFARSARDFEAASSQFREPFGPEERSILANLIDSSPTPGLLVLPRQRPMPKPPNQSASKSCNDSLPMELRRSVPLQQSRTRAAGPDVYASQDVRIPALRPPGMHDLIDLREKAADYRRLANIPTSGGACANRILIFMAEKLEYEAATAERTQDTSTRAQGRRR